MRVLLVLAALALLPAPAAAYDIVYLSCHDRVMDGFLGSVRPVCVCVNRDYNLIPCSRRVAARTRSYCWK